MIDTPHSGSEPFDEITAIVVSLGEIPTDADPVSLARQLTPILDRLAQLPEHEAEAITRIHIGERFGLHSEDIKRLRTEIKKRARHKRIEAKAVPAASILEELERDRGTVYLNPALDYHEGKMYFAVSIGGRKYMLAGGPSDEDIELIPFKQFETGPIRLKHTDVTSMNFSPEGISDCIQGKSAPFLPDLYDKLMIYLKRFIYIRDERWYIVLSLWAVLTYLHRIFQVFPYLWVTAEKGSGKSTLLRALKGVCFNAVHQISLTPAVMFRDVSNNSVSLLFDEAEQLRHQDKDVKGDIMGLLNGGFDKGTVIKRLEKNKNGNYAAVEFSVFSPKVLAGISDIDDVIKDRAIMLQLLRTREGEEVESYRENGQLATLQRQLRDSMYKVALKYGPILAEKYLQPQPVITGMDHLKGRDRDIWQPLFLLGNEIDVAMEDTKLTEALAGLSKSSVEAKERANADTNELSRLLSVLKRLIEELSCKNDGDNKVSVECGIAFEFFQKTDEFGWLKARNSLTSRLKRHGFTVERRREGAYRRDYYVISLELLLDLCVRYRVPVPTEGILPSGQSDETQSQLPF